MEAYGHWAGGRATDLSDGRGHSVRIDLPNDEGGDDSGTSGLELAALSLAGCITTIFALVADRRRLRFEAMDIDLTAERPKGAKTIARVTGEFRLRTAASPADVEACLGVTIRTCPVGVLFERAGVPIEIRTVLEPPTTAPGAIPAPPPVAGPGGRLGSLPGASMLRPAGGVGPS